MRSWRNLAVAQTGLAILSFILGASLDGDAWLRASMIGNGVGCLIFAAWAASKEEADGE